MLESSLGKKPILTRLKAENRWEISSKNFRSYMQMIALEERVRSAQHVVKDHMPPAGDDIKSVNVARDLLNALSVTGLI